MIQFGTLKNLDGIVFNFFFIQGFQAVIRLLHVTEVIVFRKGFT